MEIMGVDRPDGTLGIPHFSAISKLGLDLEDSDCDVRPLPAGRTDYEKTMVMANGPTGHTLKEEGLQIPGPSKFPSV